MKLKITHSDSNYENESEYETAVDLSHSSIYSADYTLETLSGLELKISYTRIETSYSYYEPDFSDTVKEGEKLQYVHQVDTNRHDTNEYAHMEANLNEKLVLLTQKEFSQYFADFADKTEDEKYALILDTKNPNYILNEKFYQFERQQNGYGNFDSQEQVPVSKDDVLALVNSIENQKENTWFDIELPEDLKSTIAQLEEKNQIINSYNSNMMLDNMCNQANAKLNSVLEKLTQEAINALGLNPQPLKMKI